ncbi:hypothetical protein ACQPYK_38195 [Streptosporangium sp. CA-135522]|uniref:hypothetical protein n=1 Tax=Streptosporangium sp. CA-135522 TaxID=3240072 RepID=UPI003D8BC561
MDSEQRIQVRTDSQNSSGLRFQELGADFEEYVAGLRSHLHGSSFPWPGETTIVASLYAQVMNGLVDKADLLARELGVAGADQIVMAGNYDTADACGIEAVRRVETEFSA